MQTLAPAVRSRKRFVHEPHGYVHISGPFAGTHRIDIEELLRREEMRALRGSPEARIVGRDEDGSGGLLVATATEHLAHRLGRSLQKAHGGELHHGFSHGNKLAFVWWRR